MPNIGEQLEKHQIIIYFSAVMIAALITFSINSSSVFEIAINPVLAFMLFVTFLQVPLTDIGKTLRHGRFMAALLITNFMALPLFISLFLLFLPSDPIIRLGVLLVLLTPCIDYVVTFSHLGRANAHLLLAATPILLIAQMFLLPFFLSLFLGKETKNLIQPEPFIHAFVWLIAVPLFFAGILQRWASQSHIGLKISNFLKLLPVPATALTLFIVVMAVLPQLGNATANTFRVIPFYIIFAAVAPLIGWIIGRLFYLEPSAGRSIAFSAGTRNSLVILPLALAVPNAIPVLPAIIVTQTLIELMSELIYIQFIAKLGSSK